VSIALPSAGEAGFTLMPVILAMSLIAAIAFLLNRDNGLNARMVASQSDLDRARYAAEAGLQAANFVIQRRGCAGNYPTSSSPVTDGSFGGAAYSAYSSTSGGSPLTLVSTGSYNGASVTLTRANVYVYQAAKSTTVQPGPITGQDTYLNIDRPNRNYGGDVRLRLYTRNYQSLLKFDLSGFPAGTRVVPWYDSASTKLQPGALLSLYQYDIGPTTSGVLNAQLVTRSWLEGTKLGEGTADGATWNTYDGIVAWPSRGRGYAPVPVASTPYTNTVGWVDWDLTNAVAGWMSGVYPNHGVWLVDAEVSIGNTSYVGSNDTVNPALRPKLALSYSLPCGTVASQTVGLGAQADARIRSDDPDKNFGGASALAIYTGNPQSRALMRFNLSGIPPGSTIKRATLRMFATRSNDSTANPKNIDAYALTQSWVEGNGTGSGSSDSVTWLTRNGVANWAAAGGTAPGPLAATGREESSGLAPLPPGFKSGWVSWDLTALAQGWVDGVITNHGVLLKSGVTDRIEFESRETDGAVPQLVVTYQ
jgi:hypothetical protein